MLPWMKVFTFFASLCLSAAPVPAFGASRRFAEATARGQTAPVSQLRGMYVLLQEIRSAWNPSARKNRAGDRRET